MLLAYVSSAALAFFVAAALFSAIIEGCCARHNDSQTQAPASLSAAELETLDKIHVGLAAARILSHFGLSRPPSHAKLWRKRSIRRDPGSRLALQEHSNDDSRQGRRTKFDLHVLGQPLTTAESQFTSSEDDEERFDCAYGDPFRLEFLVHRTKGLILGAKLRFLPASAQSSIPSLDAEGSLTFRITVVNDQREAIREITIDDIPLRALVNSSLDLHKLTDTQLPSHSRLQLVIVPHNVAMWCKTVDFLTLNPPALHLRMSDHLPARHHRRHSGRGSSGLIGDCEAEWDQNMLSSPAMAQLNDDLLPCCRRRVHVSFEDLGWADWIIAPREFDSFYCLGRCSAFGGFASTDNSQGAAFYTEIMNLQRKASINLTPCCSPVHFSPLTITVVSGPNEEMTQTLEDVIVQQCGCL